MVTALGSCRRSFLPTMDNSIAPLHAAPGVESYIVEDEWLLFSPAAQAMFRLNDSAAFIWACIEEGLDFTQLKTELARTFLLEADQAENDLRAAIGEWRHLGLLEGGGGMPENAVVSDDRQPPLPALASLSINEGAYSCQRYYRLLDSVIRIRFRDVGIQTAIDTVLIPSGRVAEQSHDTGIDIWRDGKDFYVLEDGQLIAHCRDAESLPPVLLSQTVAAAYLRADCLIGLHAAAVSRNNDCILFPAVSGSGKSTLAAALVASGYQYGTDELVLIKRGTHQPMTAPLGISLKPGSWPVLRQYYPLLESLPVFLRPDGKRVRYLLPQTSSPLPAGDNECRVRAVVFPRYQPQQTAGISAISPAEALCRLTEAGYDVAGGLDHESVAELVAWISGQDCYELLFDDLGEAVLRIGELLP